MTDIDKDGLEVARKVFDAFCECEADDGFEAAILAYLSHMEAKRKPAEEVARRRRLQPVHRGQPFTREELESRMDSICRCRGQYDCDCVTVVNQARAELYAAAIKADRGEK